MKRLSGRVSASGSSGRVSAWSVSVGLAPRREGHTGDGESEEDVMGLGEGEVGTGAGSIDYDGVTSCLTVTCLLADGSTVGGHLSLQRASGKLDSTEVLPAMRSLIGGKAITSVVIAGQTYRWNPAFLNLPLMTDAGDSNYTVVPERDSMWSAVGDALGGFAADANFDN